MYTIPEPRTLEEVLRLISPEDSTFSHWMLFDAMRAVCLFPEPDDTRMPGFPVARHADGSLRVFGHRAEWTQETATETVLAGFPRVADRVGTQRLIGRVRNYVAAYRDKAVDDVDDTFLFAIAILVWGGVNRGDWMTWTMHDREGTEGAGLGLMCPAYWVARWGKESLNALVKAGFSFAELAAVYESGTLPDPDSIATLAALRIEA